MSVTLLVEVKQQLGARVPEWVTVCHMGQISQPQHRNAAAGESRHIGPYD